MTNFEVTPWKDYSRKQKVATLGLLGLWAYSAYKIYAVLRFGQIFPKTRTGSFEWFSYEEDPDRYVWLVGMNSAVVAMPAFLWLLIVVLRNKRRT